MLTRLIVALISLTAISLTACTPESSESETRLHARLDEIEAQIQALQNERNVVPVTRIIDGDTIEVTYRGLPEKVRYLNVWAPEPNEPGGPEAAAYNASLVEGKQIRLVIVDKGNGRDGFGRLLADVYLLDGSHVNELVVDNTEATQTRE